MRERRHACIDLLQMDCRHFSAAARRALDLRQRLARAPERAIMLKKNFTTGDGHRRTTQHKRCLQQSLSDSNASRRAAA
jgi:hypothetical protein